MAPNNISRSMGLTEAISTLIGAISEHKFNSLYS